MLNLVACTTINESATGAGPTRELRAELKQLTGLSFRRINRYIELALLGAVQCRAQLPALASSAALYLCTDNGMLADTSRILAGMLSERRLPTPFEFMNVSGPMAAFHVAQHLGLQGPQLSIHRNHASFEAALQLLRIDSAGHRQALVGFVEEAAWPTAAQRERLHWPQGELTECSHWFYFDRDAGTAGAAIESCTRHASWDELSAAASALPRADLWLSGTGHGRNAVDSAAWASRLGIGRVFAPLASPTHSSGIAALCIGMFAQKQRGRLLHVNEMDDGSYYATVLRVGV